MKRVPSFERISSPKQWNLFFIFTIFVLAVFTIRTIDSRRKIDFSIEYGLFSKDFSQDSLELTLKTIAKGGERGLVNGPVHCQGRGGERGKKERDGQTERTQYQQR